MASLFSPDSFTAVDLTASVNLIPWMPSLLGQFFEKDSIRTTAAYVDVEASHLKLVPDSARGTTGTIATPSARTAKVIPACHLAQMDTVYPSDVQDVRAFGSTEAETIADRLVKKQGAMRRNIEATLEMHRLGAIKGQVLDADGTTVLLDLFDTFGKTKHADITLTFPTSESGTKDNPVLSGILDAYYAVEDALGGMPYTGIHAVCGTTFWKDLIGNPVVRDAYNQWVGRQDALGGDSYFASGFTYGGIIWHRYNRSVAGNVLVAANHAEIFPVGPGLLKQIYAPADYNETVNTDGQPFYSKMEEKPFNKGWDLEVQSNPLTICTVPDALIRIVAA